MKVLSGMRSGAAIVVAVLFRPSLWATALTQAFRLIPRRWWARAPFLPLPTSDYIRFRVQTQYGDQNHVIEVDDVLSYLNWLKDAQ